MWVEAKNSAHFKEHALKLRPTPLKRETAETPAEAKNSAHFKEHVQPRTWTQEA